MSILGSFAAAALPPCHKKNSLFWHHSARLLRVSGVRPPRVAPASCNPPLMTYYSRTDPAPPIMSPGIPASINSQHEHHVLFVLALYAAFSRSSSGIGASVTIFLQHLAGRPSCGCIISIFSPQVWNATPQRPVPQCFHLHLQPPPPPHPVYHLLTSSKSPAPQHPQSRCHHSRCPCCLNETCTPVRMNLEMGHSHSFTLVPSPSPSKGQPRHDSSFNRRHKVPSPTDTLHYQKAP